MLGLGRYRTGCGFASDLGLIWQRKGASALANICFNPNAQFKASNMQFAQSPLAFAAMN
ncbi:hypothetical protein [Polaromonas sp. CG9_12]|nr:hypothetical protein [Polaromonas sp. CG9_12]